VPSRPDWIGTPLAVMSLWAAQESLARRAISTTCCGGTRMRRMHFQNFVAIRTSLGKRATQSSGKEFA
jgi:hypothetical protein